MATQAEVGRLTAANDRIDRLAKDALADLFASLSLRDPGRARDALVELVPMITDRYGAVAAAVAADWFDEVRWAHLGSLVPVGAAETVPREVVGKRVRFFAGHLWTDDPGQTLVGLVDAISEYVLQPGRDTIVESVARDPQAAGWQRVTSPGACGFCRMLADRGGVYRAATATFAAHGSCGCVAVPSWDPDALEVGVMPYEASRRDIDDYGRRKVREYLAEHYPD